MDGKDRELAGNLAHLFMEARTYPQFLIQARLAGEGFMGVVKWNKYSRRFQVLFLASEHGRLIVDDLVGKSVVVSYDSVLGEGVVVRDESLLDRAWFRLI